MVPPWEDLRPLAGIPNIEIVAADVLDPPSLERAMHGADTVYHLAGMISILPGKDLRMWQVNVEGTRNVLTACTRASVQRLIHTSSIHAIARAPHGVIIDETIPFDPQNPFGEYDRSKATASLEVLQAVECGLDAVIVSPTGVIGPYDFRGSEMGQLVRDSLGDKPLAYVDGAYDFVDVRDVAQGMILASENGRRGENYILSGENMSVRSLLDTLSELSGKKLPRFHVPIRLARWAAHLTPFYYRWAGHKPRFTPYSLEVLESNANISHEKAERELGYKPRSLRQSLADTLEWLRENRSLLGRLA
jgi:dihydroflavonol-4-reductase